MWVKTTLFRCLLFCFLTHCVVAQETTQTVNHFPRADELETVQGLLASPEGAMLIAICKRDPAFIFGCDLRTGQVRYKVQVPESYNGVTDCVWGGPHTLLLITSDWYKGCIREFDTRTGRFGSWLIHYSTLGEDKQIGEPAWIRASRDGKVVVVGWRNTNDAGDYIRVYGHHSDKVVSEFQTLGSLSNTPGYLHSLFDLDVSADGTRIVTSGSDNQSNSVLKLWDSNSGKLRAECILANSSHLRVAFNHDGTRVVTAGLFDEAQVPKLSVRTHPISSDNTFSETPSNEIVVVDELFGDSVPSGWTSGYKPHFQLSTDGKMAIVATSSFFRAFNMESGRIAMTLGEGDSEYPNNGSSISPDGKFVWIVGNDSTIQKHALPDVSAKLRLRR